MKSAQVSALDVECFDSSPPPPAPLLAIITEVYVNFIVIVPQTYPNDM